MLLAKKYDDQRDQNRERREPTTKAERLNASSRADRIPVPLHFRLLINELVLQNPFDECGMAGLGTAGGKVASAEEQ